MTRASIALMFLLPGVAFATPDRETRGGIGGEVGPTCLFAGPIAEPGPGAGADAGVRASGSNGRATVTFLAFVDPVTASPLPIATSLRFETTCNFSHRVGVTSRGGGMNRVGATSAAVAGGPAFATRRDYAAEVAWAGGGGAFATTGRPGEGVGFDVRGAHAGDLDLRIDLPAAGPPLQAGAYEDVIVIDVSAVP